MRRHWTGTSTSHGILINVFQFLLSISRRLSKALDNVYGTYRIPFSGDTVIWVYAQSLLINLTQLLLSLCLSFLTQLLLEDPTQNNATTEETTKPIEHFLPITVHKGYSFKARQDNETPNTDNCPSWFY